MDGNNNLQAQINAVHDEITQQSTVIIKRDYKMFKALTFILLVFIVSDWLVNREPGHDAEADVNHILLQAQHEVLDYYHRYERMPEEVQNPALKPYVTYKVEKDGRFNLIAQIGGTKKEKYIEI